MGGVVAHMLLENALKPGTMKKLRKMLAGIGYAGSCGIKPELEDEKADD